MIILRAREQKENGVNAHSPRKYDRRVQTQSLAADGVQIRKLDEVVVREIRAVTTLRLHNLRAELLLNVGVLRE